MSWASLNTRITVSHNKTFGFSRAYLRLRWIFILCCFWFGETTITKKFVPSYIVNLRFLVPRRNVQIICWCALFWDKEKRYFTYQYFMIKNSCFENCPCVFPPRHNLAKAKTIHTIRSSIHGLWFKYMTDVVPIAENTVLFTVEYLNLSIKDSVQSYSCIYSYVFYKTFISAT